MKLRNKILIIIIIIMAISIVVSFVIQYILKYRNEKNLTEDLNSVLETQLLSTSESNNIGKIINNPIFYLSAISNNNSIFYLQDNNLYKTDLSAKKSISPFALEKMGEIRDIQWFPNDELALVDSFFEEGEESIEKNIIYNLKNKKIYSINFQNSLLVNSNQFVAQEFDSATGQNTLLVSNFEQSETTGLIYLAQTAEPAFVNFIGFANNKVYFLYSEKYSAQLNLYSVDIKSKENKLIVENIANAIIDPSGNKILIAVFTDETFKYSIINNDGSDKKDLDFTASINQFLWNQDGSSLYFVSGETNVSEGKDGTGFLLMKDITKINSSDLQKNIVANFNNQKMYGAIQLILSPDETKIYFTNYVDSYLYSINLK